MYAKRLDNLPPYLFAQIDKLKSEKRAQGIDIIDLGVGDPDLPTPPHIVDSLCEAARDPSTHHYPDYTGMLEYREAVATWYKRRFNVS
ncbi:MAG: aminotransferase class I/II-fold pyridoxal phosphate-dependent enzyme, partial [Methanomicrobium sp.]|nr:aminotransferase class I/II-fold pyridoxal phosphate-dependent enzyme [Methanomicrobium sp.]